MLRAAFGAIGIWLCALGLGGCGESQSGGDDANTPPGNAPGEAEFPAEYAQRFCDLTERCCTLSGGIFDGGCLSVHENASTAHAETVRAAGATFDAARAAECLEQLANASCAIDEISLLLDLLPHCRVYGGLTPPDGDCNTSETCDQSTPNASSVCIGGTCQLILRLPPGLACSSDNPTLGCEPLTAVCDEQTQVCQALPGPGDACDGDCQAGSTCDAAAGLCVELGSVSVPCESDNECASDVCRGGQCASLLAGDSEFCELP